MADVDYRCFEEGQRRYCTALSERAIDSFKQTKAWLNELARMMGLSVRVAAAPEVIDVPTVQVFTDVVQALAVNQVVLIGGPWSFTAAQAYEDLSPDQLTADALRVSRVLPRLVPELEAALARKGRILQREHVEPPAPSAPSARPGRALPYGLMAAGTALTVVGVAVAASGPKSLTRPRRRR